MVVGQGQAFVIDLIDLFDVIFIDIFIAHNGLVFYF